MDRVGWVRRLRDEAHGNSDDDPLFAKPSMHHRAAVASVYMAVSPGITAIPDVALIDIDTWTDLSPTNCPDLEAAVNAIVSAAVAHDRHRRAGHCGQPFNIRCGC